MPKEMQIDIGGKLRLFRMDLNALVKFEETTGLKITKYFNPERVGVTGLRALLWAGLLHGEPELKIEEVGSWLSADNIEEAAENISKAMGGEAADPLAKDGGGSGPSGATISGWGNQSSGG